MSDDEKWLEGHRFAKADCEGFRKYLLDVKYVRVFKGHRMAVERIFSTKRWEALDECEDGPDIRCPAATAAEAVRLLAVKIAERLTNEVLALTEKVQEYDAFAKEIVE